MYKNKKSMIKISVTAPSRSQIKKEDPFLKLELQIMEITPNIRLEKFFLKNLPSTAEEFLINFFTIYNIKRNTIFVDTKEIYTLLNKRRSLGDIYRICKYYYPEVTLKEIIILLFSNFNEEFTWGFRSSYCTVIKKRVFYYDEKNANYMEDERLDEFKNNVSYYIELTN